MDQAERSDHPLMTMRQRIIVAMVFGLLIGLITLQSAAVGASFGYAAHGPPNGTLVRMRGLAQALDAYRANLGMLPADLKALHDWETTSTEQGKARVFNGFSGFRDGAVRDGWGNPLIYTRSDSGYVLTSLGADGAPGGEGIDSDIARTSADVGDFRQLPKLTIRQMLAIRRGGDLAGWCSVSGLVAGLLCFVLLRRSLSGLVLPGLFTLLATAAVTYVMGILDIVKYH